MNKTGFIFFICFWTFVAAAYHFGFNRGCKKVIGPWEKEDLIKSKVDDYCYGNENLFSDSFKIK